MKGKTRIIINRETLGTILQDHINATMVEHFELEKWTVHRNGSVELELKPEEKQLSLVDEKAG